MSKLSPLQKIYKEQDRVKKKKKMIDREWYSLRSLLGNDKMIFYMLLGGREAG